MQDMGEPVSLPDAVGEMRERAERARRLARETTGGVAEGRLLVLAEELEARIAVMEGAARLKKTP
jgi:hypothetical protein